MLPANFNVLLIMPVIIPSLLYSIALLVTLLAKPVIGIIVPAPANCPNLSYIPKAVKIAERKSLKELIIY